MIEIMIYGNDGTSLLCSAALELRTKDISNIKVRQLKEDSEGKMFTIVKDFYPVSSEEIEG